MYLLKGDWSSTSRVSPFGYQGIYACLRLPLAFRSLPRPSSALGALASTLCSSSLDYVDPETRYIYFRLLSNLPNCNWSFKTFSRLSSLCSCQGAWVISHPDEPKRTRTVNHQLLWGSIQLSYRFTDTNSFLFIQASFRNPENDTDD